MSLIYAVSQVGLALYMFLVGLEFQVDLLRERFQSVVSVSLAGILAPVVLGSLMAFFSTVVLAFLQMGYPAGRRRCFLAQP